MNDKLKLIADFYELPMQLRKLAEECSEFSAAYLKEEYKDQLRDDPGINKRAPSVQPTDKVFEELVDIFVLVEQIQYLIEREGSDFKDMIAGYWRAKIARQLKRMEEEKAK